MLRCARCGIPRQEGSFETSDAQDAICNPCKYRPREARVKALRHEATELERAQAAVRYVVKHTQADQPFVYLIRVGQFDYKVGTSRNINKRLRQLATASSQPIQLIAVAPGGRQQEQELHQRFRSYRIRLEWFRDTRDDLIKLFSKLPAAMVFLPGYVKQDAPVVTG